MSTKRPTLIGRFLGKKMKNVGVGNTNESLTGYRGSKDRGGQR
jgi:hypothetical protein